MTWALLVAVLVSPYSVAVVPLQFTVAAPEQRSLLGGAYSATSRPNVPDTAAA